MNFVGQEDGFNNDDLMDDDDDMAQTPSAATEDCTLRNRQISTNAKNEYDIDMDDTEETKEEPSMGMSVPVENVRQASKSLAGPDQLGREQAQTDAMLGLPQGGGEAYHQGRHHTEQGGDRFFDDLASKRATYLR